MKIKTTLQILAVCLGLAALLPSLARASGLKSTGAAALGLQSQQRPAELIVGWTAQLNILSNATTIALGGTSTTNVATTNGITNLPPTSSELKPYDTFLLSVDSDQLAALRLDLSGTFDEVGGIGGLLAITQLSTSQPSTHRACADANGNVTALVNAGSGQPSARYDYAPFGELLRASGDAAGLNPFRFSTKYVDAETGLIYYGYRYYSAGTGKWINRDPSGESGGRNLYAFVENCPISKIDPNGLLATLTETEAATAESAAIGGGESAGLAYAKGRMIEKIVAAVTMYIMSGAELNSEDEDGMDAYV